MIFYMMNSKIIESKYDLIISIIGAICFFISIVFNDFLLAIVVAYITCYSLELKIIKFFGYIFAGFFLTTGSFIYAILFLVIVMQSQSKLNSLSSYYNKYKISLLNADHFFIQRYVTLFMVFVVINIIYSIMIIGVDGTLNVTNIFSVISSSSLIVALYMSLNGAIQAMYFYLITILCRIAIVCYIMVFFNQNLSVILLVNILVLAMIGVYYLKFKNN